MIKFLGLLAWVYAVFVVIIAIKQPPAIWDMAKIRVFRKVLGDKGTVIFFYIWSAIFIGLGIWAFIAG